MYANDVNNVDVYIGGVLESHIGPGILFSFIISVNTLNGKGGKGGKGENCLRVDLK